MQRIIFWSILIVIGIIGTGISLLLIPISPIYIVLGIMLLLFGHAVLYIHQTDHNIIKIPKIIKQKAYFGFALIFSGFTLSWILAWFTFLCYFRYSTYLFTIYL